jgi:hypothetical protein
MITRGTPIVGNLHMIDQQPPKIHRKSCKLLDNVLEDMEETLSFFICKHVSLWFLGVLIS